MADWLVGPVMDKIIDKCFDYFKDQGKCMKEELERLRINHTHIQAVLSVYSQVEIKDPHLNKWYWQLRDAIDEADDVLDDIEYRNHQEHVSKNKKKRKFVEILQRTIKNDPDLKRLEEAVQKLDKISSEVSPFLHLLDSAKQEEKQQQLELHKKRETGSVIKNNLLGRSNEMEFIRQWLRDPYEAQSIDTTDLYRNISLLSIVGHGGMGKTTLLQHVYKDATTHFDVKIWVCVSTNFDAKIVIANILKSLKKQVSNEEPLDSLQTSLQSEVTSKRFLLVLDDIWEADEGKWEDVLAPLQNGNPGSKILITTRMDSVASKFPIENKKPFQLKGLEKNECFVLFKTHAFGKNSNINEGLLSMAGDIVKKLSGCPLAVKIIGSSLKSKDVSYWRKILNTDIGNIGQNDILPILKLSYTYLPDFLQICFAFCCIFEQDHQFDKDDLVRMWISLGFIQSPNNSQETVEETGISYFDILVEKSFFDKVQFKYGNNHKVYYQMHDLLHELAQSVSKHECFRAMDVKELSNAPKTIRYLSLNIDSSLEATIFKKMRDLENLHSLFLFYRAKYDENFVDVLSKIFEASKTIRLLYIVAPNQKEISEMICRLTHLRYFNLESRKVDHLPRSISQLYHLQIIIYNDYYNFNNWYAYDFLPKDINNLCNLRYLRLPFHENCMVHEIGKLKSLQELNYFYVKNEIGYGIEELKHMNELRKIRIHQLENIKDAGEAWSAKFSDKKNLTDLSLQWGDHRGIRKNIVDHDLDEKVLDSFQPYNNNLKSLEINAYMGVRSSIWMSDVSVFSNLEYIKLKQCFKWKTLPPFGQLPFLKSLYLIAMPEVEQLDHNKDCMFPSLEVLYIENLKALQEWFDTTIAATNNGNLFPCLTKLYLINCPKLQELPSLPTKLQKLEMKSMGWKGCNWLQGIRNCSSIDIRNSPNIICLIRRQELKANENCQLIIDELVINDHSLLLLEPLRSISSLRILTIENDDELVSFSSETEQWFLQLSSSLLELTFNMLKSLESLPSSLESFPSLETLRVFSVPQLKLLPNPPTSLVTLELLYLKSLQCLPSSLSTISSLRNIHLEGLENLDCPPSFLPTLVRILTINEVPRLLELPDLPSSLNNLDLRELESLQCLPSSLSNFSSLTNLTLKNIPLLKSLPDLPSSLQELRIEELESLNCLLSSLSTISSLMNLTLKNIPALQSLPDLPSSLKDLELESLQCLPSSLSTFSSLKNLKFKNLPLLKSLLDLPFSLEELDLRELESLQCLPSSLSNFSSLTNLTLKKIPVLQSLPDLPSSLEFLELEALQCLPSSLSTFSSLTNLDLKNLPFLKSLPDLPSSLKKLDLRELESLQCLPSSLSNFSSLTNLTLKNIPALQSWPDLPSSLEYLELEALQCLPSSLSTFSSLTNLKLKNIPLLKSLPDLPSSVWSLHLKDLENLDCLPSYLPASLKCMWISNVPRLMELPDLPASLTYLNLMNCDPQLMERYPNFYRRW